MSLSNIQEYLAELKHLSTLLDGTDSKELLANIPAAEELVKQIDVERMLLHGESQKADILRQTNVYRQAIEKAKCRVLTGSNTCTNTERPLSVASNQSLLRGALVELQDTEQVQSSILHNLETQRAQIQHATETARQINSDLCESNKLLNRMGRWFRG